MTVAPTPASITTAQQLSVQVTVSGPTGIPTPTGSVTLSGGGYTPQAQTLSGGITTFIIPAGKLAGGTDTLIASYTPNSNSSSTYTSATQSTSVTVTQAATAPTVSVTPTPTSITTAEALTVTVGVSGGGGNPTPTGSVTLTSGSYTSAAAILNNGSATINIPAGSLTAGTDTLSVSYTPDKGSSSTYTPALASTSITVQKGTPAIDWPYPEAITYGTALSAKQLDATPKVGTTMVAGKFDYNPPAGTVLEAGSHSLSLTFIPTDFVNYSNATASSSLLVNKVKPALKLTASANSVTYSTLITFKAAATATGEGSKPAGTVTFLSGAIVLGKVRLNSNGVATYSTTTLAAGAHNITVSYSGDSSYIPFVSAPVRLEVNKAMPKTKLSASASSITYGASVTLTAAVTGSGAKPAGTVNFLDGVTKLGTGTLNSNAVATFATSKLAVGKHSITAAYAGDIDYAPKNSAPVTIDVSAR
jgi:hypothetical protein